MSQQKATYLVLDLDENDILPFSIHGIFFSDFSCLDAKTSSFWRFRFGKSRRLLLNHLHILILYIVNSRNMTFSAFLLPTYWKQVRTYIQTFLQNTNKSLKPTTFLWLSAKYQQKFSYCLKFEESTWLEVTIVLVIYKSTS